jgi:hypothetical protein
MRNFITLVKRGKRAHSFILGSAETDTILGFRSTVPKAQLRPRRDELVGQICEQAAPQMP